MVLVEEEEEEVVVVVVTGQLWRIGLWRMKTDVENYSAGGEWRALNCVILLMGHDS